MTRLVKSCAVVTEAQHHTERHEHQSPVQSKSPELHACRAASPFGWTTSPRTTVNCCCMATRGTRAAGLAGAERSTTGNPSPNLAGFSIRGGTPWKQKQGAFLSVLLFRCRTTETLSSSSAKYPNSARPKQRAFFTHTARAARPVQSLNLAAKMRWSLSSSSKASPSKPPKVASISKPAASSMARSCSGSA